MWESQIRSSSGPPSPHHTFSLYLHQPVGYAVSLWGWESAQFLSCPGWQRDRPWKLDTWNPRKFGTKHRFLEKYTSFVGRCWMLKYTFPIIFFCRGPTGNLFNNIFVGPQERFITLWCVMIWGFKHRGSHWLWVKESRGSFLSWKPPGKPWEAPSL